MNANATQLANDSMFSNMIHGQEPIVISISKTFRKMINAQQMMVGIDIAACGQYFCIKTGIAKLPDSEGQTLK